MADPSAVGASTMYAATRFNAFIVARATGSSQNMKLEKERALEIFHRPVPQNDGGKSRRFR
jgi:hypothetical protein